MKRTLYSLLFMAITTTSFAGTDKVVTASIDKDSSRHINSKFIPPAVKEKYEYYDIKGNSEKDLSCQITQNGCSWKDGKTYASVTSWNITWNYGYEQGPQGCRADSFKASVVITFRYPKWMRPDDAPVHLVDSWEAYMEKLVIHENGHRDIAIDAAADLTSTVLELPAAASCLEVDQEIRSLGREWMAKLNVVEKEYDITTNHGTNQGAIFPKPIYTVREIH